MAKLGLDSGYHHRFCPSWPRGPTGGRNSSVRSWGPVRASCMTAESHPAADPAIAPALALGPPFAQARGPARATGHGRGGGRGYQADSVTSSSRRVRGPARAWLTWCRRSPSGTRVVVSTATKALQDQLAHRDLPQLLRVPSGCVSVRRPERPFQLRLPPAGRRALRRDAATGAGSKTMRSVVVAAAASARSGVRSRGWSPWAKAGPGRKQEPGYQGRQG